ncbi:Hcp family type VI secretion system effector [Falsiroseomonas oryziterrae]|uniref:Hcp family type VI secretion system effector n=1 Tax=Falsiroseomonas oryziterrae TaxID=2911368 RepID=UPI001F449DBA|nr:type VI secretion system tube protein Hcp [Roseomonas sp. NPKOSM-4]
MSIYMKYGSTIKGDATTKGWADWITLGSVQMGAGRGLASSKGKGANREASEPSISEITVSKEWDPASSSKLFEESVAGKLNTAVEIHFTTTSGNEQAAYLIIKLKDCGISGYSFSGSGMGKGSESLSLNFSHIEITPKIVDEALGTKDGTKVSYDLTLMKANV